MIKHYLLSRKQLGISEEKRVRREVKDAHDNWSLISEQMIKKEKETITAEKELEIKLLKDELEKKNKKITELRKTNLKVDKLKNDLHSKIRQFDFRNKRLIEFQDQISIQVGRNEAMVNSGSKLLLKEVK